MALFLKFFYPMPPDGLLQIAERVYVFDCCFKTDVVEDENYKAYISGIVGKLRGHLPDASFMVFNFREGENQSQIADILSEYDMTVIDYPRQYEGCPVLTMEMIHYCLKSGESWLSLGPNNVLLMHCDQGGWPTLAFMLAALLIFRKLYSGEQKTLDIVHKQAPRELLQLMSPLNPLPSQLRYLQYVSRRNLTSEWPPPNRALTLDCIILRLIPNMDGEGGCRLIVRIYGQDPLNATDRTPKVLFSTPKRSKNVRYCKQAECELFKIDVHCHVQGDVVLECISLDDDLEREQMMFRVMFSTAFIRSNMLMLNCDEIDTLWNVKDRFPKDFITEVLFSEMDAANSDVPIEMLVTEEKEGLPVEAFAEVQELFNSMDWMDSKTDVALNVPEQITASTILKEKLEIPSHQKAETGSLEASSPGNFEKKLKLQVVEDSTKSFSREVLEKQYGHSSEAILDNDLLGQTTANYKENASIVAVESVALEKLETARLPSESISFMVSGRQQLKKGNSEFEASDNIMASVSMALEKQLTLYSGPSLDENMNTKKAQPQDFPPPQQPSHSKIMSPRILQYSHSSSGSYSNSLQGSPNPMQRFNSSPSSLGITTLLHDHDTCNTDVVAHLVARSPQPSSTLVSSVSDSDVPKVAQQNARSTSELSPPPVPQPRPPPPPPPVNNGEKGRGNRFLGPNKVPRKRRNLKQLHWIRLLIIMEDSLWAELQKKNEAFKASIFEFPELEELFPAFVPKTPKGEAGGRSSLPASVPKNVQLIEPNRARNCEIMLTKVKIPLPDLMNLVLELDDSNLDVDLVENLIKFCPTKEERALLKGYKGDKEKLGKCEKFFLELMKVPRVESKLRIFSFKIQFSSRVSDLRKNLNIVSSASVEIRTSEKLKRIMQTILSLGNALNQGTKQGSAAGFQLDSLLKLRDTRSRDNKITLLHYLCKKLAEKLPELLDFPKELPSLEASTKIQWKFLAEEMQAINNGLQRVDQELTASGNDGPETENFYKNLKQFRAYAQGEVESLKKLYSTVGKKADALSTYFGENSAKCPFEQVVSTLLNFVKMFIQAHDENCKQHEFEKRKAEKEAKNNKLKMGSTTQGKDSKHHDTLK